MRLNRDWAGCSDAFTNHPSFDCRAAAESRDGMWFAGDVGIGPYTAVILSQDQA